MSNDLAIEVKNVTKGFKVYRDKRVTLKERIIHGFHATPVDFMALQNVSLNIQKGTTVGLIGVNGSGKSTLLKIISRILYPDEGTVHVKGRVSSLLELGAGFHPDFTGRENIFMNGALLGLSKKEIKSRMEEIIDFSELGDFIEQPIRSYSSGMYMRLAFSVAVAVDPEILLIDEILAVGDAAFQAKCMSRLTQLRAQGKTIVMVTHDLGSVERFCDSVVWMHNSHVHSVGTPVECIQSYLETVFKDSNKRRSIGAKDREETLERDIRPERGYDADEHFGNGKAKFISVDVRSSLGENIIKTGSSCTIVVNYEVSTPLTDVVFGFSFFTEDGKQCYGTNTFIDRLGTQTLNPGLWKYEIDIPEVALLQGNYYLNLAIHSNSGEPFDFWRMARKIMVTSDRSEKGILRVAHRWSFE